MATSNLGFDNFFSTTLAAGITASTTAIQLNNLPTASEGFLVIEPDSAANREIIYYTSKTSDSVVCPSVGAGRGQGGTTAISHSQGATVKMNTVAEMFEALQDGSALTQGAILPNSLVSGSGTTWVWQSWTPTLTNLTLGNGTVTGAYTQIGKTIIGRLRFTFGSTSSITGAPIFSTPVTASSAYTTAHMIGTAYLEDLSTAAFYGFVKLNTTTTLEVNPGGTSGSYLAQSSITSTVPFTWATGDFLAATFMYEAA